MSELKFVIPDGSGHTTEVFEKADKMSMEEAEKRFMELTGKGFRQVNINEAGEKKMPAPGDQKFDPNSEEVMFVRPIQGG